MWKHIIGILSIIGIGIGTSYVFANSNSSSNELHWGFVPSKGEQPIEMGAQIDELMARIRCLQRRKGNVMNDNTLVFSDISLNLQTYELTCNNNSLHLGLKEFSIMEVFMNNSNMVISKEKLIEKIWGYESDAEYNNVEVYISFLRKKLNHIGSKTVIKTIRGVGYRLEES
jgi:DNA-binding response OmpR family regulator